MGIVAGVDVANTVGTWLGVAISIGGFSIAIWQIRRTQGAVEAARRAILDTQQRLTVNQLLVLLPQLAQLEMELEEAAASGDLARLRRNNVRWRQVAAEADGLLGASQTAPELSAALRSTIRLTASAKPPRVRDGRDLTETTEQLRGAVSKATALAAELLGRLKGYT